MSSLHDEQPSIGGNPSLVSKSVLLLSLATTLANWKLYGSSIFALFILY